MPTASPDPNSPLTWMDAVDRVRLAEPEPPLTVASLAPRIEGFYKEQGLMLGQGQAAAAAALCLAPEHAEGSEASPVLPWKRPSTPGAWADLQAKVRHRVRCAMVVAWVAVGAIGALLAVAGMLTSQSRPEGLAGVDLVALTLLWAILSGGVGYVYESYRSACLATITPWTPSPAELAAVKTWMKDPRLAQCLRQIHHSGVPMLKRDAIALKEGANLLREERQKVEEHLAKQQAQERLRQALAET